MSYQRGPRHFTGDPPPDQGCPLPPEGWYCSAEPGHEGPCPTRPRPWMKYMAPLSEELRVDLAPPAKTLSDLVVTLKADPVPLQSMVDRIRDQLANLTARHREESVTLFFQPKPWWLPRPLWKYLLRRLTTVVFMREPPFAMPPVTLSGWPSANILRDRTL